MYADSVSKPTNPCKKWFRGWGEKDDMAPALSPRDQGVGVGEGVVVTMTHKKTKEKSLYRSRS